MDKKQLFKDIAQRRENPNILPQLEPSENDDYFIGGTLIDPKTRKPVFPKMNSRKAIAAEIEEASLQDLIKKIGEPVEIIKSTGTGSMQIAWNGSHSEAYLCISRYGAGIDGYQIVLIPQRGSRNHSWGRTYANTEQRLTEWIGANMATILAVLRGE